MNDQLRQQTVELFRSGSDFAARLKGLSGKTKDWAANDAYDKLNAILQSRDLTINLKACSWFIKENPYTSYAQMYELAIDKNTGEMILDKDSDPNNPPDERARVDDLVTFPQNWQGTGGNPTQRGLDPRFKPSTQRILGRMQTGPLNEVSPGKFKSPNALFNPKTKQAFAALNYGQRRHGSSIFYGKSYFVLKPELKVNAIYFPADTFVLEGANMQVSYHHLASILLKTKQMNMVMFRQIISSCLDGQRLEDTSDGADLIEAHIFEKIQFASHISKLYLSLDPGDVKKEKWGADSNTKIQKPMNTLELQKVRQNAQKFCNKFGISYFEID
jgi:hypothetical protein